MKETICFITSHAGENIEPQDYFRKDGCYGSEYALLETARRLTDTYNVFVTIEKPKDYFVRTHGGINWIADGDFNRWVQYARPQHVVVMRFVAPFVKKYFPTGTKIYYWLHDLIPLFHDPQLHLPDFFTNLMNRFVDRYISVGQQVIDGHYGPKWRMDRNKFTVIKNGITLEKNWDPFSTERRPLSFVFSSSVGKGLWKVLEYWPRIVEKFSSATLDIYYGYPSGDVARLEGMIKDMPSVKYHGKVVQSELFQHYKTIDYWFFPCQEEETCSTTTFETAYYGPIQLTNKKGPLVDNVSGFKFDDGPGFLGMVLETIESLEGNRFIKKSVRKRQFDFACKQTWNSRAEQWKDLFKNGQ